MNSIEHYKELIASLKIFSRDGFFENQLEFTQINEFFYNEVYLKKRRIPGNEENVESLSSLQYKFLQIQETCSKCAKFWFSAKQNRIYDKQNDILTANFFETGLIGYLNNLGFSVVRGDDEKLGHHKGYPDLLVYGMEKKPVCYIEVKYNASPFLTVSTRVPGRECYEGSLTLNPEKLERQFKMVGNEINIPIFYVYWADFPCIKGVYFTNIQNIWDFYQRIGSDKQHDRRTGFGDFKFGKKIGQTGIIYPPILEMGNFEELIKKLTELIN